MTYLKKQPISRWLVGKWQTHSNIASIFDNFARFLIKFTLKWFYKIAVTWRLVTFNRKMCCWNRTQSPCLPPWLKCKDRQNYDAVSIYQTQSNVVNGYPMCCTVVPHQSNVKSYQKDLQWRTWMLLIQHKMCQITVDSMKPMKIANQILWILFIVLFYQKMFKDSDDIICCLNWMIHRI